jgi:hypothetical protein
MRYRLVTDRQQSLNAFSAAEHSFAPGAQEFPDHSVGWPSGSGRFLVNWRPDLRIWGVFEPKPPKSQGRRFWICFGLENPTDRPMLSITVETNPPHEGVDRRVAGAFLEDEQGQVYLAHSGKVGGGRKGVGPNAFLSHYTQGERVFVPERGGQLIILGCVSGPDLAGGLAAYTREVARFKEEVRG